MGVCRLEFSFNWYFYRFEKEQISEQEIKQKKKFLSKAYNNDIVISVITRRETNHIFKIFVESLWNFFFICLTD